jgi:hypothetical protein
MVRALKSQRYATRNMMAGDEFEVTDGVARILKATKKVEDVPQPEPARRGRPPKAAAPEPEPEPEEQLPEPTREELLSIAEARGIELPSGYVRKDELIDLINADDAKAAGE